MHTSEYEAPMQYLFIVCVCVCLFPARKHAEQRKAVGGGLLAILHLRLSALQLGPPAGTDLGQ